MSSVTNEFVERRCGLVPTLEQRMKWLFRLNAVLNVVLSIRGILDPTGLVAAFGGPVPNYPFLVRLWSGLLFLFGIMFWETSRDVRKKAVLIKYNWIEKLITACAATFGFVAGDVPGSLLVFIVFTNWLWIPLVLYADIRLRRDIHVPAKREHDAAPRGGESDALDLASRPIAD
jgi:hypothetical protein